MKTSTPKEKIILFSHGFGIRKDNLGLFDFLAEKLTSLEITSRQFDYYDYNTETKEVVTFPFSVHADKLKVQLDLLKTEFPEKDIVIIAQSQGGVIPAFLSDLTKVTQVIAISPYFLTDREEVFARYAARPGNETNLEGTSYRPHKDGTITVIPKEYWDERFRTNPVALLNRLAEKVKLTLLFGKQDSLIKNLDQKLLLQSMIINIDANHDFTGDNSRETLWDWVKTLLFANS